MLTEEEYINFMEANLLPPNDEALIQRQNMFIKTTLGVLFIISIILFICYIILKYF